MAAHDASPCSTAAHGMAVAKTAVASTHPGPALCGTARSAQPTAWPPSLRCHSSRRDMDDSGQLQAHSMKTSKEDLQSAT
ncbi:hypothetical protein TRIUR3_17534 [Triticum urartu]|uniref:Uncharacterized protein n=1 Tax=Triticum urartu TaxID=4572 RepID=M7Z590_TRIUA|nr:hypothetical protein TRIUR3_17534 [Triticum urartu]